jgi:hypothetical protein
MRIRRALWITGVVIFAVLVLIFVFDARGALDERAEEACRVAVGVELGKPNVAVYEYSSIRHGTTWDVNGRVDVESAAGQVEAWSYACVVKAEGETLRASVEHLGAR